MTDMKLYRPARDDLVVPMPDRGNRRMPMEGAAVNFAVPYYRRLRDDGDIVAIDSAGTASIPAAGTANETQPATAKRKNSGKD